MKTNQKMPSNSCLCEIFQLDYLPFSGLPDNKIDRRDMLVPKLEIFVLPRYNPADYCIDKAIFIAAID
jgi:hypothetical protein